MKVCIRAPVGAGKSRLIRRLTDIARENEIPTAVYDARFYTQERIDAIPDIPEVVIILEMTPDFRPPSDAEVVTPDETEKIRLLVERIKIMGGKKC